MPAAQAVQLFEEAVDVDPAKQLLQADAAPVEWVPFAQPVQEEEPTAE